MLAYALAEIFLTCALAEILPAYILADLVSELFLGTVSRELEPRALWDIAELGRPPRVLSICSPPMGAAGKGWRTTGASSEAGTTTKCQTLGSVAQKRSSDVLEERKGVVSVPGSCLCNKSQNNT